MARYRNALPQLSGDVYLTDAGVETDLIFKMYAPRSVEITPDQYLNFYELREEFR